MASDMVVFGDKELLTKLARLGKAGDKIARDSSRSVAKDLQAIVKAEAPVKTGRLRKGIKVRGAKRSRQYVGSIVRLGTRKEMGIPADAKHYYPAAVMYGQEARGIPGRNFLLIATERFRARGIAKFRSLLARGIASAARAGR